MPSFYRDDYTLVKSLVDTLGYDLRTLDPHRRLGLVASYQRRDERRHRHHHWLRRREKDTLRTDPPTSEVTPYTKDANSAASTAYTSMYIYPTSRDSASGYD